MNINLAEYVDAVSIADRSITIAARIMNLIETIPRPAASRLQTTDVDGQALELS